MGLFTITSLDSKTILSKFSTATKIKQKNQFSSLAKELVHHLIHAILAETHTPMYMMHKYWARKPHNVVSEYIKTYTEKGDVVLDPFCGSGVTVIEALKLDRQAIGVDLDPVSIFITRMTGIYIDIKELEKTFQTLKSQVIDEVLKLYETECTTCKKTAHIWYIVFKESKADKIYFECSHCKTKDYKSFSKSDNELQSKIDKMKIPYWYPTQEMVWNTRINIHKGMKVSDLFSKRNLIALSIIYHAIEGIKDDIVRDIMKFAFSAALPQASKLLVYTQGQGPGWKIRGFWIPPNRYEMNVWRFFENKYKKVLNGKKESNLSVGKNFKENHNVKLYNKSITDMAFIEDNSVDYIFTDPPYGDSVPYLELNYMWSAWQKFNVDFQDEIIISDSPERHDKNEKMYEKMMVLAFKEMFRVLKRGHWMTLTFHNTDIKIYNIILRSASIVGFDFEKSVYQPPAKVSAKAELAPFGSAVGDYYIRFKKPFAAKHQVSQDEIDKSIYKRIVTESIKKIIAERGEPTPYTIILNSYADIYQKLKESGYLFSAPEGLDQILKESLNKDFVLRDGKWWFKDPSTVPHIQYVPLHERVETAVIDVLNKNIKISFDDVLKAIFIQFPNALTPEVSSVKDVLAEYAEPKDGKWILKPNVKSDISEHNQIVENLAELGKKLGYGVYADIEGWREHDLPFSNKIPKQKLDRIKEIDCIWYDKDKILYDFEVEHSTGITEAIVRGSNIPYPVKKFIIIPESRERKLTKKIQEPLIKDKLKSDNWGFIRYHDFRSFYELNKRKKKINVKALERLNKHPNPPRQTDMSDFFS